MTVAARTTAPNRIRIALTLAEYMRAASIGAQRCAQDIHEGRKSRTGQAKHELFNHGITGACGEAAVAKWCGLPWDGAIGNFHADDVGPYQVRTRSRDDYELALFPKDKDDRAFILVTGEGPVVELRGWIIGRDAKRQAWWRPVRPGGPPAYVVRHADLYDLADLPAPDDYPWYQP